MEDKSNGVIKVKMTLAEEVTFFNKGAILKELDSLPRDSSLELDVTKTRYLDNDIIEILEDFQEKAQNRNIFIILMARAIKNMNFVISVMNPPQLVLCASPSSVS